MARAVCFDHIMIAIETGKSLSDVCVDSCSFLSMKKGRKKLIGCHRKENEERINAAGNEGKE